MPALVHAQDGIRSSVPVLAHTWASKKINGAIWGVAIGDVTGDGAKDIVYLERNAVRIGSIEGGALKIISSYEWEGLSQGARLFLKDIDGDSVQEILVSAVFNGMPDSFGLKWEDGKFKTIFEHVQWHLRVTDDGTLLGQQRDYETFFAGYVYELSFDGKKLKAGNNLKLPKWAAIYDFTMLPGSAENPEDKRVLRLSGNEPLLLYERQGKRLKKVWSSGVRFDGTLNIVEAVERQPLGMSINEDVPIDKEPQVSELYGAVLILAARHDIPLKGVIGRRPFIRNGRLVAWKEDPSLGFAEAFETEEVPGYISDYSIVSYEDVMPDPKPASKKKPEEVKKVDTKKIIASIQQSPSMWGESPQSVLLIFDLP